MASTLHHDSSNLPDPSVQVCIVGDSLRENEALIKAIQKFDLPIVYCPNGVELTNQGAEFSTIYVLEEFEGELYTSLHKAGQRILGPTAVMQYAENNMPLPNNIRPLYTISMRNLVISFSGFRVKEELHTMVALIHHMGGCVRKDFNVSKTTHLVVSPSATSGEKYKFAAMFGIPIMSAQWVFEVWARRHDVSCNATHEEFMQFKVSLFGGCKVAFIGYQTDQEERMTRIVTKNGGEAVVATDPSCTHMILEDGQFVNKHDYNANTFNVKNEDGSKHDSYLLTPI